MTLKARVENLDDLPESMREHYEEDGDGYTLAVDGVREHPEVTALRNAYKREQDRRREAEQRAEDAESGTSDELATLKRQLKEAQAQAEKGGDEEVLKVRDRLEADNKSLQEQIEKLKHERTEMLIGDKLNSALQENGVREPAYLKAAQAMLRSQIRVDDDDKPVIETDMGPKDLASAVKSWVSDEGKAFVTPASGGGAKGGGAAGQGAKKPEEMTEAERVEMYRNDPEGFRELFKTKG